MSISSEIVNKLGLVSDDRVPINSVSHEQVRVKLFQVNLSIPITDDINTVSNPNFRRLHRWTIPHVDATKISHIGNVGGVMLNLCTILHVNVIELPHHDPHYHILLGMDVLSQCNFFMAHGKFVLAY